MKKIKSLSKLALVVVVLVFIIELMGNRRPHHEQVLEWDVQEYYMYLPALFLYNDPSYKFVDTQPDSIKRHFWFSKTDLGNRVGRMTMGMAITYSPFFLLGHISAIIFNQPQTGFSPPYQFFILISGFFYTLLGLILLRKSLRRYFNDNAVAITILLLGLATNLYYYVTTEGAMTHATLFGLFSVFIYAMLQWYDNNKLKYFLLICLSCGLSILIRPTSILIALIFFIYGIAQLGFKNSVNLYLQHYKQLLLGLFVILCIGFPQLLYWKIQSGHWLYYSYHDEHFFFNHPHIIDGFFSYRKGWLVYTPVMTLSLIGFFFLFKYAKSLFLPILIFTLLNIYVVLSWWCWWYGGSFGMRALIESYVFLAFPMCALWQFVLNRRILLIIGLTFAGATLFLNIFQSKQYRSAMIHWDSMTKKAYWKVFLKMDYAGDENLQTPDYEGAKKGHENKKGN